MSRQFLTKLICISFTVLSGCGGSHLTEIKSCIPETSIVSTRDIIFYFIEVANRYEYYSSLKNSDQEDNYLCFHDDTGGSIDQCDYNYQGKVKVYKLEQGSKITFDGYAVKSVKWGFNTIDTGPSPTTWFRGKIQNKTIWVTASDLQWMYESKSNFKDINKTTYEKLKLEQRIPDPLIRDSNGTPTKESWIKYSEQEKKIHEWDCNL